MNFNVALSLVSFIGFCSLTVDDYYSFAETRCQIIYKQNEWMSIPINSSISLTDDPYTIGQYLFSPHQIIFDNPFQNMTCAVQINPYTSITTSPICFTNKFCVLKWERERNEHLFFGVLLSFTVSCILRSLFSSLPSFQTNP